MKIDNKHDELIYENNGMRLQKQRGMANRNNSKKGMTKL